jgi:L-aminopeptidase/D-esterase-like protein
VITDVSGVRVGHAANGRTGCTVVLLPAGTVASGEVRGGAPGTREFALLAPERLVPGVNAVVLSGGSAFGLAACDGVAGWCEERGIGFPTPAGPVPIVVGMVLYDLMVSGGVRPSAADGRAACDAAVTGSFPVGPVGAGAGATVRKWTGRAEDVRPGGLGTASVSSGALVVGALLAVNAVGDLPGGLDDPPRLPGGVGFGDGAAENTTIGVVATNASLDKVGCLLVAQSAHDGLARALDPAHLSVDGDAVVACAVGAVEAPVDHVRVLAAQAVELAVRSALSSSQQAP